MEVSLIPDRRDQEPEGEIVLCRDLDDLGRRAAIGFARSAVEAVSLRGRFSAALSGGTTPRTLYRRLARPEVAEKIPWRESHLFWGDERAVPPDHPGSNYRTAYETLISRVPIPPENVHRMPGEKGDLEEAAREYEAVLRGFFKPAGREWPRFDLILLGIGADGHTASLFPGSAASDEKERWVVPVYPDTVEGGRLTLTLPVLNHARLIFFLAAGREKAPVIRDLFSEGLSAADLPARRVHPRDGGRIFFLDREAAALIAKTAPAPEGKELR